MICDLICGIWSFYWRFELFLGASFIVLALLNVTLGLRRGYVRCLISVFNWARKRCALSGLYMEESYTDLKSKTVIRRARSPHPGAQGLIESQGYASLTDKCSAAAAEGSLFELDDIKIRDIVEDGVDMARWGMEVVVRDEVTHCFSVDELPVWNLMTRTDRGYTFVSWRLTALWLVGVWFRLFIMFPARLFVMVMFFTILFSLVLLVGWWPDGAAKRWVVSRMYLCICRVATQAVTVKAIYHNKENKAQPGSICVANHTNFLDFALLGAQNHFAVIGQRFSGFQGLVQRAAGSVLTCVWFDRANKTDRAGVKDAMRQHTLDGGPPILIFPEGTCVNSSFVMRFRKGAFEVGAPIYPVAIKYDRVLGEPFYYQDTWYQHLGNLMTSWAIKADIHYLPPMRQRDGESSIEFARRVKEAIAEKGELVDIDWEGELKYFPVRDDKIKKMKELYSQRFKRMQLYFDAEEEVELEGEEETVPIDQTGRIDRKSEWLDIKKEE